MWKIIVRLGMLAIFLSACDKEAESPQTPTGAAQAVPVAAFRKSGEWLTVHVDNMALKAFAASLQEQTGSEIMVTGRGEAAVTVHVEQASLRQVLAAAFADRPYQATMQYANLQDSFPARVEITIYGDLHNTATDQAGTTATTEPAAKTREQLREEERLQRAMNPPVRDPAAEAFYAMSGASQTEYFLQQSEDRQAALASGMDVNEQTVPWMQEILVNQAVTSVVKAAVLDSLQLGDYATSLPAIQTALGSGDSAVVVRAIEALAQLGSAQDVPAMEKLASEHPDSAVREAAQDAIDLLGL